MTGSAPDLAVEEPEANEDSPAAGADEAVTDSAAATGGSGSAGGGERRIADLEQEGEIAADYIEGLLDIVDMDGDLDLDVEGGRAVVAVVGDGLDKLIGTGGETLEALQELTRLAVLQKTGVRSRLMLDVGGHRARRRVELRKVATSAARKVLDTGEPRKLAAMTPFERKVVHDVIATIDGVHSESEGEEPSRRVVVLPD
ncbi:spoIIIJ-associated protein [Parafrankia irregularis]|uniref:SpoIIIJ-associated protein n=1 Tax=Parafrankia irregularis TaxID=795642 RepID=A0A0S4QPT0_9ACTN|nr:MULTISPECIES: R3H domain-containing nucleic acid-binding protein [Parafrankia]MBE3204343.1 single-stranded DNA-binding protein [Parafrankia sp. CH37]CUU57316.1 spoIIIJ-associated protein [Parafrankia irregularis]